MATQQRSRMADVTAFRQGASARSADRKAAQEASSINDVSFDELQDWLVEALDTTREAITEAIGRFISSRKIAKPANLEDRQWWGELLDEGYAEIQTSKVHGLHYSVAKDTDGNIGWSRQLRELPAGRRPTAVYNDPRKSSG
ncbi:hypothetical protein HOG48_02245 [Candidatus Peregrinibacteria bacterium]|jgi:hypothetical protein|nr:hypothetical protein [Candidatus Peregrinibacteria bacterium]